MAYSSGAGLGGLAGLVGGAIGAYFGYNEAVAMNDMAPWMGAAILGGVGFVVGSAGAFILKSAMQFIIYILLFAILAFFFHNQIEALTGIDPIVAFVEGMERIGLKLPGGVEETLLSIENAPIDLETPADF